MNIILAVASVLALFAVAPTETIQREAHDHTIYTVHGSADQLAEFHDDVGSQWQGGVLLKKDEHGGFYRYWAFSERTAPQARTFILGSIMRGVRLDIEAYEEREFFPVERSKLDEIATSCGLARDPFFITPTRELRVSLNRGEPVEAIECAWAKLRAFDVLKGLKVRSLGHQLDRGTE